MPRYARIELLVYVSFWLLITSFAVVSSWNLEQVRAQVIYHKSEENQGSVPEQDIDGKRNIDSGGRHL